MFTNFVTYKLERKGGKLVEINRCFPSSNLRSNCFYQIDKMPLNVRPTSERKSVLRHSPLKAEAPPLVVSASAQTKRVG
jgi:hypothetical protein